MLRRESKPVFLNLPDAVALESSSSCCADPPIIMLFPWLLHNWNFATVTNRNAKYIWRMRFAKGVWTHRWRTTSLKALLRLCTPNRSCVGKVCGSVPAGFHNIMQEDWSEFPQQLS